MTILQIYMYKIWRRQGNCLAMRSESSKSII